MDFDVAAFLEEPLRPASVATVTPSGLPALATMWFLFEDERFWFHTPGVRSPFVRAARASRTVAAMVETFDPDGRVMQVRATGTAKICALDGERVNRIYDRYLGPSGKWSDDWKMQAGDATYSLWRMTPESGVAIQFPNLCDAGGPFRWNSHADFMAGVRDARRPPTP